MALLRGYPGDAVLIVHDDPVMLESTALILRRSLSVSVHEAAAGSAGIETARRHSVDLALIDLGLPDMSGLDLIRTLRHEEISIPWVLISAFMDYDAALRAGRLGALRAVSSPFDVEEIVRDALAETRASRQAAADTGSTVELLNWNSYGDHHLHVAW